MFTLPSHPLEERLAQLLRHLGIERAHFAGCMPRDWEGLVCAYPDLIASLTLITPMGINVQALETTCPPLLTPMPGAGTTKDENGVVAIKG